MARYGCTITVQTGEMPSTQTNFSWLAVTANFPTEAINGGVKSILNGGGNLRCYTDSGKGTRLSIQLVKFVTGGSPSIELRGLSASLGVGDTVYIEGDTVATVQPAPSATYGSEDVWVGYLFATTDGGLTDSSGNLTTTATGGAPLLQSGEHGGDARRVGTSGYYISSTVSGYTTSNPITTHSRFLASNTAAKILSSFSDASTTDQQLDMFSTDDSGTQRGLARSFSTSISDALSLNAVTLGSWQSVTARYESNVSSIFANGAGKNTGVFNNPTGLDRIGLGATSDSTAFVGADYTQGFGYVFNGAKTDDYIASQENNESNPSAFWSTSAWVDQDAGGITTSITESGPSFTDSIASTVTGSITASIAGLGPSFSDSISVNVASAGTISASIAETGPGFTDSISSTVTGNITASIVSAGPSFTDSVSITVTGNITTSIVGVGPSFTDAVSITVNTPQLINTSIVESGPSFIESILMSTPTAWVDKAPATTVWTDSTISSTIWQDK